MYLLTTYIYYVYGPSLLCAEFAMCRVCMGWVCYGPSWPSTLTSWVLQVRDTHFQVEVSTVYSLTIFITVPGHHLQEVVTDRTPWWNQVVSVPSHFGRESFLPGLLRPNLVSHIGLILSFSFSKSSCVKYDTLEKNVVVWWRVKWGGGMGRARLPVLQKIILILPNVNDWKWEFVIVKYLQHKTRVK